MIEREFIAQKTKEYYIKKFVGTKLDKAGVSSIRLKKIPLGEKIIIETSRPSLIVGSKGANIKELTRALKKEFKLENPQIEINEVKNIFLDPAIVAERIAYSLERFGSARFKGIGHKTLENVMTAGALGVEIIISGKIPSTRARNWRFYQGYLKKCGDVAIHGVKHAQTSALLKSGIIGIKVSIMPPDIVLPDHIEILEEAEQVVEEITEKKDKKGKKKTAKKTSAAKKKTETKEVKETEETSETKVEATEDKVSVNTEAKVEEKSEVEEKPTEAKAVEVENEEVVNESLLEKAEHAVEHLAHEVKEEIKHVVEGVEKGVGKVVEKVEEVLHIKHEEKSENVPEEKSEETSVDTPEDKEKLQ
ncbi:30S ribosomal protein S3 [Candidatus Woesearchaeota archaeon]|jgi:small subunit ribosomal protein S3|nr:30S ribosomal protein S3 [Candidatus Woesearchaeota archaeon]MBT5342049.1 30S ribosomal protein S3 [Candidatus Woesearchaeota archaeon]